MKHIFLNLKRFDIPREAGGVNSIAPMDQWGRYIVSNTQENLKRYENEDVEFAMYFPEAHLIPAVNALAENSPVKIGCQGVYREDTAVGGNFGAFTTNRTANAAKAIGCTTTIIGHCEERRDKAGVLLEAGVTDPQAVSRLMNKEIGQAIKAGLSVLYCIGESAEEQPRWQEVLREQLETGLFGVDTSRVVIAYEPVWAIGPGKTPPDGEYIARIGSYIKEVTGGLPVVYGGGLKTDNARMLASIPVIDGGLIALTRFQGEIGFYPEEYLEIIKTYLGK
ncbi:triose-phosphate isomerase family protein [Lacrimispora indolis]|uniref:triose-phosphate isomerase family protein n=1 Tax=Lacrimispora indolis TaxID=69825 RepID=UPI00041DF7EF|nr:MULTISPECIES: triose-phosphate isomerase family protein [Lachnospiraceae]MBE7719744.1 triosephosphate isomerase [Lacrimispora celerecrescens]